MGDLGDADSLLRSDWIFEGIDDSVFKKTQMANNAKHMAVLSDQFMLRTLSSPFLLHLREEFDKKIASIRSYQEEIKSGNVNAVESYRMKMKSYLTHDTFLTPIMILLGLVDLKCVAEQTLHLVDKNCQSKIPQAAAFVFELNEKTVNGVSQFYINVTYRGKYFNICKLEAKDTDEDYSCPHETFNDFIGKETFSNWEYLCEKYGSDDPDHFDYHKYNNVTVNSTNFWYGLCKTGLVFGIMTLIFIIVCFWSCRQIFRYGMLNSQIKRVYEKIQEEEGVQDEDNDDSGKTELPELTNKVKDD